MKDLPNPISTVLWEDFPKVSLKRKNGKICEIEYSISTTEIPIHGKTVALRFSLDSTRSFFALDLEKAFVRILTQEKEHGLPIEIDTSLMYAGSLYVRTDKYFPECSDSMAESLRGTLIDLAISVIREVSQTMEEFE